MITLIFCAAGNKRYAQIARDTGYLLGARLPGTVYLTPLYFSDQNWKHPDRQAYINALREYRPTMASVMDWEQPDQLAEVLSWAEDAAQYVDMVMIIPKVQGGVSSLPRTISGKPVRLGYSVPTTHGGTELHLAEFVGWPVHLLGGSPAAQMRLSLYLDVLSVDGNMMMKMANRVLFWQAGPHMTNRWYPLIAADGQRWNGDGPYEAFRRSCENIMAAWKTIGGER